MKIFIAAGFGCLLAASTLGAANTNDAEIRIGSGETVLERYKDYGYTAAVLGDITQLASYEAVAPGAIPKGSPLQKRIEHHLSRFQKDYDRAGELGLGVCVLTDEVEMPAPVLDRFRKSIARSDKPSRIAFEKEAFWELYRAKYREVLKAFPRIAYVIVRTGENYSHLDEGYAGHTVLDRAVDDAYIRNMQRLINETRKVVVDEFGRTLIWRTWDLGNNGFHANPAVYDRILAGIAERRGLVFSIKFTQTDFWRYNDFNPMIGRGGVAQIVEFQCAREYEGKGAFPDYVGPEHAEALRKARSLGAKGVWIWDSGGGWGGPFLKSDRWVRLNIEATARLAVNPDLSPRTLAEEWAAREFGAGAAAKVAEVVMLSPECVRKCAYIAPYARDHKGWMPSRNLMRDDIIRGEAVLRENGGLKILYEGSKHSLAEVLEEKQEAVELASRMRVLFEDSRASIVTERGEQVYQETLSSLLYLEGLTKVMGHYVRGMFLYYEWRETGQAALAASAELELVAWRQAWTDYQANVPKLPGAASLYRSQMDQAASSVKGAMADTCETALRSLTLRAGSQPPPSKLADQRAAPAAGSALKSP